MRQRLGEAVSALWGYRPVGYLDEREKPVLFESRTWDPAWTASQVSKGVSTARDCGLTVLYVSAAPKCKGGERHTHTGRHFECSLGCTRLQDCKERP